MTPWNSLQIFEQSLAQANIEETGSRDQQSEFIKL